MKKRAVSMFLAALMAASGVLTGIGGGGYGACRRSQ